jgi:hypothetical protein
MTQFSVCKGLHIEVFTENGRAELMCNGVSK